MAQEYPVHWLEAIIKKIEARNPETIVISAGKTPSGHIHIGILRELIIGDSVRRIFEQRGEKVYFRIFFDSLDAAKRFPSYINRSYSEKHLGKPFAMIPPPFDDISTNSYAEYFGRELLNSLPEFGIKIKPIWAHELYNTEQMKKLIQVGLKKSDKVKKIVLEHITHSMNESKKKETYEFYKNWMPAMVICEKCGCTQKKLKDGTIKPNRVLNYNRIENTVTYHCPVCKYQGEISINSGSVKLNWRLDWPAKWVLEPKNLFEGSGKDHYTKITGSWDVAIELCREIYDYEGPVGLGYEWLRLGDKDMSTSKGVVFMPKTYLSMVEPELFRMLILNTTPSRHISFRIEEISQLYDEYEKIERIYFGLEEAEDEKLKDEIKYYYPLTIVKNLTEECPVQIPFRFLIIMAQLQNLFSIEIIIEKAQKIQKIRGIFAKITVEYMQKRLNQTQNWLNHLKYLIKCEKDGKKNKILRRKADFFNVPKSVTKEIVGQLNEKQKLGLKKLGEWLISIDELTEENLKEEMIKIKENINIKAQLLFQSIYLILIGAKKGPRLGPFMVLMDLEFLRKRFLPI
ncbi:MAG: lysine--tRNA ligase [Promethearchaeota archaeon]